MSINRIQKRFDELAAMAEEIEQSKSTSTKQVPARIQAMGQSTRYTQTTRYEIDLNTFQQWCGSVELLLFQVFGEGKPPYDNFKANKSTKAQPYLHLRFDALHNIFKAAKADYEGGYIFDLRAIVSANLFTTELEQAQEFLDKGYKIPAAVVAGIVLEVTLRELCEQNGIGIANLNRMNDDLAKGGIYNDARKTQIQTWAKIRNNAAHGKPEEFNETEVANMISGLTDFVANQIT